MNRREYGTDYAHAASELLVLEETSLTDSAKQLASKTGIVEIKFS